MMAIQFRGMKMGKRCWNQTEIKVNKLIEHSRGSGSSGDDGGGCG